MDAATNSKVETVNWAKPVSDAEWSAIFGTKDSGGEAEKDGDKSE